ncbi:PaaI family thioesterase [Roseospirillum parvum]|uniref:Uncharacterized domain 1-containing protein n=1 Tax=Roseospirillum parvum TaxID=83401 RepID=A0A1G8EJT9_9PROT|nr:PaaI family thioesterase [Roseospirillum parvum]SDH70203.1 uncharacterized domain 1-containing protein [Roseospirillum parvum]
MPNPPPPPSSFEDFAGSLTELPQCRAIGLEGVSLAADKVILKLPWRADLVGNPITGVIHGGAITTLLDTVCGIVTFANVPRGRSVATLDLRIDYLKPAEPGVDILGAGEVYRLTRSVAFVRATAYQGEAANAVANCVATFMIGSVGFVPDLPGKREGA